MTPTLARKEAAKRLGIELESRYRKMLDAEGEDQIVGTTVEVAKLMNDNIEFVIYCLKKQGGLNPLPPELTCNTLPTMPAALR
jgi:hypothetical protein